MDGHAPRKHRRSVRLAEYDYGQAGAYFVTICTAGRVCLFGEIVDQKMQLNRLGQIVEECWIQIPEHLTYVGLDASVVMPNHVHEIVTIQRNPDADPRRGAACCAPTPGPRRFGDLGRDSLAIVVRSFKAAATRAINLERNTPGAPVWQRNYHEHIVRNEGDLNRIRGTIAAHPTGWAQDDLYLKEQ